MNNVQLISAARVSITWQQPHIISNLYRINHALKCSEFCMLSFLLIDSAKWVRNKERCGITRTIYTINNSWSKENCACNVVRKYCQIRNGFRIGSQAINDVFNGLYTKGPELCLKVQFGPRSKHSVWNVRTCRRVLCGEIIALCWRSIQNTSIRCVGRRWWHIK